MDVKNDYDSLTAYLRLTSYIEKMLISIGFNVLAPNHKAGILVVFMYAIIFSFTFCMGYSVANMLHDYRELLKCMAVFGIPTKGFVLSTTLHLNAKKLYRMHLHLIELHRNSRGAWSVNLRSWVRWMDQMIKCQCGLYMFVAWFLLLFPIFYFVKYGEKILMIHVMVPFLSPTSGNGYLWICVYELYCSFLSVVILCTGDAVFILMCFSAASYLELVKIKCEQLTQRIRAAELPTKRGDENCQTIQELLVSTVIAGHKANEFVESLGKIYNIGCLIQIYTTGLSLAICVMAGRMTPWIVAYPMGFALFYQIMIFSYIGTVLETKSDELSTAMYNVDWYLLSVSNRRMFLLMFSHSQKTIGITLMGSRRLNFETGMGILNTIYSGYMMMDGAF